MTTPNPAPKVGDETREAFERLAAAAKNCLRTYERVTGRVVERASYTPVEAENG